jgi:elongation factor Ts
MAISAQDVKALREKTGAGMMECKKALEECGGDAKRAEKLLKEKGLAAVEKRAGRAANEGTIFIKADGKKAVLAELATETDFVARNPEFIAKGEVIVNTAFEKDIAGITPELEATVSDLAVKIREKMGLKRLSLIKAGEGEALSTYSHGDGAIGVCVVVKAENEAVLATAEVKEFIHDLALHVAAFNPLAISEQALDRAFVEEQTDIFKAQMTKDEEMQLKPAAAQAKILEGKVKKYIKSISMLDQNFVKDDKINVAGVLEAVGKKTGTKLSIASYTYMKVGTS